MNIHGLSYIGLQDVVGRMDKYRYRWSNRWLVVNTATLIVFWGSKELIAERDSSSDDAYEGMHTWNMN